MRSGVEVGSLRLEARSKRLEVRGQRSELEVTEEHRHAAITKELAATKLGERRRAGQAVACEAERTLSARRRSPSSISSGESAQNGRRTNRSPPPSGKNARPSARLSSRFAASFRTSVVRTSSGSVREIKNPPSGRVATASGMYLSMPAKQASRRGAYSAFNRSICGCSNPRRHHSYVMPCATYPGEM